LEKEPASFDALLWRAQGRLYRAVYKMPPGADPLEDYGRAEEDTAELTRRPTNAMTWTAWRMRGDVAFLRARYLGTRGRDAEADFAAARAAYQKTLEISKGDQEMAGAHASLGQMLGEWASQTWRRGRDPSRLFKEAEDHFVRVVKMLPDNPW